MLKCGGGEFSAENTSGDSAMWIELYLEAALNFSKASGVQKMQDAVTLIKYLGLDRRSITCNFEGHRYDDGSIKAAHGPVNGNALLLKD